jgi:hypothetical protein
MRSALAPLEGREVGFIGQATTRSLRRINEGFGLQASEVEHLEQT